MVYYFISGICLTDVLTLLIGALIGIISAIVGYVANHLLSIREQRIERDFEIREKGRDFFHQTYGAIASLSDLVVSCKDTTETNQATVLTENGYVALSKEEIIERYKTAYAKYVKMWYESREKGLEIFLMKDFVKTIATFWAYAGYFNEDEKNWDNKEAIAKFAEVRDSYCERMDKLMGLSEPKHLPKWLNPKNWYKQLRGKKLESI